MGGAFFEVDGASCANICFFMAMAVLGIAWVERDVCNSFNIWGSFGDAFSFSFKYGILKVWIKVEIDLQYASKLFLHALNASLSFVCTVLDTFARICLIICPEIFLLKPIWHQCQMDLNYGPLS